MPTAFLLMDSTYGTDDRCHDDSSELGSIAWLFLYTYVITCVCSTSAARSPPPCSAAAAVLVITHVLFTQLPLINIFSKHFPLSLGALLQGTGLARAAHDCCWLWATTLLDFICAAARQRSAVKIFSGSSTLTHCHLNCD